MNTFNNVSIGAELHVRIITPNPKNSYCSRDWYVTAIELGRDDTVYVRTRKKNMTGVFRLDKMSQNGIHLANECKHQQHHQ